MSIFALVACSLGVNLKMYCPDQHRVFSPICPSSNFLISDLMFQSVNYFELILISDIRFCIYIFSLPNIIHGRNCPFPIVYYWHLCQRLIGHVYSGLFGLSVRSQWWNVYFYASSTPFNHNCLPCSTVCGQ